MYALLGTTSSKTINLRATVGTQTILLLVDSGSSHSFLNQELVQKWQLQTQPTPVLQVKAANGDLLSCSAEITDFSWHIQEVSFSQKMKVVDLGGYDAVLGMDWLSKFRPMTCDWEEKWIEFEYQGKQVRLHGVGAAPKEMLEEASFHQIEEWYSSNELWAVAVVLPASADQVSEIPHEVQEVLDKFADVFGEPKQLPPHISFDHAITLFPNTTPVNTRPYRYAPHQKDEIERQVAEMIQAGVVSPSLSPFASPVLLVKKKDNTWRFCVDYRKLNLATVKNKFPIPTVEELLMSWMGQPIFPSWT